MALESTVVAAFGLHVAFLHISKSLVQPDDLVAGFAKSAFSRLGKINHIA